MTKHAGQLRTFTIKAYGIKGLYKTTWTYTFKQKWYNFMARQQQWRQKYSLLWIKETADGKKKRRHNQTAHKLYGWQYLRPVPAALHYTDGLIASAASLLKKVTTVVKEYCFNVVFRLPAHAVRPLKHIFSSKKDSSVGNKYFTVCNERCK